MDRQEKGIDELKEIRGEIYSLAPVYEHGEESTRRCTDEDNEDGADPQMEMSVSTAAAAAILFLSGLKHFFSRISGGGSASRGGARAGRGYLTLETPEGYVTAGVAITQP